jgi:hypothetical protein
MQMQKLANYFFACIFVDMQTWQVTIKFDRINDYYIKVAGTIETEEGFVQRFYGGKALHNALDIVTERQLRRKYRVPTK